MTTLVVSEIRTALSQEIRAKNRILVKAVRPYILKHLSPSGSLTLSLKDGNGTIKSKTLTTAEIEANSDDITGSNYFHGFINFEFDEQLTLNRGVYTVELSYSDTFDGLAYFGWIHEYENETNDREYLISSPNTMQKAQLGLQIWSYKKDYEI